MFLDAVVKFSYSGNSKEQEGKSGHLIPLSYAQERLWFLEHYEGCLVAAYNVSIAFELKGQLDVEILRLCFEDLLNRHQILRTTFQELNGQLQQVIAHEIKFDLPVLKLSEDQKDREIEHHLSEEAKKPFDLSMGPLIRGQLLRVSAETHILLLTQHHIITDGWSIGIFFNELSQHYSARIKGAIVQLKSLPMQYADFALSQREWLKGELFKKGLVYWKERLYGYEDLQLPIDFPRPLTQTLHGSHYPIRLSASLRNSLQKLARNHEGSLFTVLLTAFNVLLSRYSGQNDIVIGSLIANRHYPEIEGVLGFFVNTLPLRTKINPEATLSELLRNVTDETLEAYQHQDVPFEKIVEALQVKRDLSRSPLFQVMLILHNGMDQIDFTLDGLKVSPKEHQGEVAKFDLTVSFSETEEGLNGDIEYNTDLFTPATVERFAYHFEVLLNEIVKHPSQRIKDISFLSPAEKNQILIDWTQTEADYPREKTIHQLFEDQAVKTPDAIALIFEDLKLTYRELNSKANQVAHRLRSCYEVIYQRSLEPNVLIGLCLERRLELVIGMLGILKAGAAYVPLDPNYPKERLRYMLEDTMAPILLTQENLLEPLSFYPGKVLCLDRNSELVQAECENCLTHISPSDLAYVIYTSGSTGKPKGVMIAHQNTVALLAWSHKIFGYEDLRVTVASTSICFDLSIFELFTPLTLGGAVLLVKDLLRDSQLLSKFSATLINTVPSIMKTVLSELSVPTIRTINFCGEVFDQDLAEKIHKKIPQAKLCNFYGPTEDATYSTYYFVEPHEKPLIGKPISNKKLYILDQNLQPCPIGVSGELYIGGVGVARGYLNKPELTKERFIENPFATAEDQVKGKNLRLYRTGDVGRWLVEGNIDFLGRTDHQVKIRGFRIECGEIEQALLTHHGIEQAVVIAQDGEIGKQLVAYYVAKEVESAFTTEVLRSHLMQTLPEYMVPQFYVELSAFPLSPSGKLDRQALPRQNQEARHLREEYVPPRYMLEQRLVNIWQEVLKCERIGIHDNFFTIGGHSLIATQVASRIRQNLSIDCPIKMLFSHPTIAQLSDSLQSQSMNELKGPSFIKADRTQLIPFSYAQERLWFLEKYQEGQIAVYNIPIAFELKGKLDVESLRLSFEDLLNHHEILRTTFQEHGGQLHQIIATEVRFELPIYECSDHEINRHFSKEAMKPFDLSQGPLIRGQLLRRSPEAHLLLLTQHHIITDGWSIGIFFSELSEYYRARINRTTRHLKPLSIQYADFALSQREWLQGEFFEKQLSYWKERLLGYEDLQMPIDFSRPMIQTFNGNHIPINLSNSLRQSLNELARDHQGSLFTVLLTAFTILLSRYSGQDDVVIGSPIANRHYPELEEVLGFFVNTLPLRTKINPEETVSELLKKITVETLEAYQHQDVPFEKIVEALQVKRDLNRSPLFQAMLVLQNASNQTDFVLENLTVSLKEQLSEIAKFDLTVSLSESEEGLIGEIEYNTDLFSQPTIERLVRHFVFLLEEMVKHPGQRIKDMSLLNKAERNQILVDWNQTDADYSQNKTVHQLFEEQVAKTPEAIALIFEDQELTYRELNERANQVAHTIRSHFEKIHKKALAPDTLVALCIERSLEMMIGMLGILKAGAAYVPLDPNYPKERLRYMLEDTAAPILLTQESLMKALLFYPGQVLCLDSNSEIAQASNENPVTNLQANNLAYVIYTSGSTGKPKGVIIEHQGVCSLAQTRLKDLTINSQSRVLQVASLSFDVAVYEWCMTLVQGATLCIVSSNEALIGNALIETLKRFKISIATVSPSLLKGVSHLSIQSLQTLVVTGEASSEDLLKKWCPNITLLNAYGPTEVTVYASSLTYNGKYPATAIGRPIANKKIYILDRHLQPCPIGVTGELYIGGVGVARGYLNQPELTSERFIENPFINDKEKAAGKNLRLYRTGDLARWLPDGNIDFLGRIDHQVKIRGFRIECGEIEQPLLAHPDIEQVVVIAYDGELGNQLVAYYIAKVTANVLTTEVLRHYLLQTLPDYMIPQFFVELSAFPLTTSGKLDRQALPQPNQSAINLGTVYVPANDLLEQKLVEIWQEVLKRERIGIHDNFFSIGGHSLLATQVVSRIKLMFGCDCPIKKLFSHPTIAQFSDFLQSQPINLLKSSTFIKADRTQLIPLSYAQERLWFLEQYMAGKVAVYNLSTVFELKGKLDPELLRLSFEDLLNRHEILRTAFQELCGKLQQIIASEVKFELPIHECADQEIDQLFSDEVKKAFDLSQSPLIRGQLFKVSQEKYILLLTQHHIITDGWSMGIFFNELSECYRARINGTTAQLKPLSIQYADFALSQRVWLQGEFFERQFNYWKERLLGYEDLLLPTDFPRPLTQTFNGNHYPIRLSNSLKQSLKALARNHEGSLFTVLLTAFNVLLSRYSGQDDIVIGSPIANRHYPEVETLLGFFVNILPLRTKINPEETVSELLKNVIVETLEAYQHQDVPFEKIVEALQVKRDLSRSPLFQVMLVLQNTPNQTDFTLENLNISPKEQLGKVAKFDLTVSLSETEEGLSGEIEYNTDLFSQFTIERLIRHFEVLLNEIVRHPTQRIKDISLLTPAERKQVLVDWNQTEADYPQAKTIHQLFEEQVAKTPDAIALIVEDQECTYRELNARSNQVAHTIRSHFEKIHNKVLVPDTLVALCIERSLEMMIGILGILKAGAAYVPLDPTYPKERLRYMLEDTAAPILLTQESLMESLSFYPGQVLCLDSNSEIAQASVENSVTYAEPDNLAYVIYTSGSTGKPKGVMVEHQGLCNLARALVIDRAITSKSRVLQLSSLSFDVAVSEWSTALTQGAALCLIRSKESLIGNFLVETLNDYQISVASFTPALLKTISDSDIPSLKTISIGGEVGDDESLKKWYSKVSLLNEYGPTEATVCASILICNGKCPATVIGKPITNKKIYILDRYLQPCAINVSGELYIGGVGVARGYLNQPELTKERFIENPFVTTEDKACGKNLRLFRTGDLGRWLHDGNIEFLGRDDQQVKIRGFRIECGEIEQALLAHRGIDQVVVIARDGGLAKQLVAYYVPKTSTRGLTTEALRHYLMETLPEYMVPQFFVELTAFSMTYSGKLNRQALPQPSQATMNLGTDYISPRNALEQNLVEIWQEVLKLVRVGIHDNFFSSGGSSLLIIKLMMDVKKKLGISLSLSDFFIYQTVSEQAKHCINQIKNVPADVLLPIQLAGTLPPLFLIHPAGGNAFPYLDLASYFKDRPIYGINNPRFTEINNPFNSIQEMAENYIEIIKKVQPTGPYYLGGWSFGGLVALEVAQQLKNQGAVVDLLILIDTMFFPIKNDNLEYKIQEVLNELINGSSGEAFFDKYIKTNYANAIYLQHTYSPNRYEGRVSLIKSFGVDKKSIMALEKLDPMITRNIDDVYNGFGNLMKNIRTHRVAGLHDELFDKKNIEEVAESIKLALQTDVFFDRS